MKNFNIAKIARKILKQYNKTFKDLARYDRDNMLY